MQDADKGMVERVARALHARWVLSWPTNVSDAPPPWNETEPSWREEFMENARAAIAAMREPSIHMRLAGILAGVERKDSEDRYRAMIDAVLKSEKAPTEAGAK